MSRTAVRAGRAIAATLTVTDMTGHRARFDSCVDNGVFDMILDSRRVPQGTFTGAVACSTTVHPGDNVFHAEVSTDYGTCGGDSGHPCPSPLPAGIYHTVVNWPQVSSDVPGPGILTVRLTR
jgi:hypothetical protein